MLNIYKASAGAGKTYTLTLEYLKLLFQDVWSANIDEINSIFVS